MGKLPISLIIFLIINPFHRAMGQASLTDQFIWDKLMTLTTNPRPKFYEGSPYLIDSFVSGKITLTSNTSFTVPVRYNLFDDVVEVLYNGREMGLRPEELVTKIEFAGYQLILTYYPGKQKEIKGFLFLLDSGKVSFLQKRFIVFEEWQPTKALESGPTPAKFREDRDEYFVRLNQGKVYKIKTIKEIPDLLPGHRAQMEAFIKEKKIKLKPEYLVRLSQYYNSL